MHPPTVTDAAVRVPPTRPGTPDSTPPDPVRRDAAGTRPHTDPVSTLPTPAGAQPPGGRLHVDPAAPAVLRAEGEIDIDVVHRFAEQLGVDEIAAGRTLAAAGVEEVDLSGATFIDSSAIALLVSIAPHRRPERLRVRGATGAPLMTLQITGLDSVLELVPAGD